MKRRNENAGNVALGGIITALSFVLLYIGTLSGVLDMSASVLCGLLTLILMRETSRGVCFASLAATAVLAFVLIPDKTAGVLFVTLSAAYPFARGLFPKAKRGVKIAYKICLAAVIVLVYAAAVILFIPAEATAMLLPAALALGVPCILIYDVLLSRFAIIYELRLRHLIKKR